MTALNDKILNDGRYRYVACQNEYDLYKDNDVLAVLESNSNYDTYKYSKDYTFNLFQKSYVRWKLE